MHEYSTIIAHHFALLPKPASLSNVESVYLPGQSLIKSDELQRATNNFNSDNHITRACNVRRSQISSRRDVPLFNRETFHRDKYSRQKRGSTLGGHESMNIQVQSGVDFSEKQHIVPHRPIRTCYGATIPSQHFHRLYPTLIYCHYISTQMDKLP